MIFSSHFIVIISEIVRINHILFVQYHQTTHIETYVPTVNLNDILSEFSVCIVQKHPFKSIVLSVNQNNGPAAKLIHCLQYDRPQLCSLLSIWDCLLFVAFIMHHCHFMITSVNSHCHTGGILEMISKYIPLHSSLSLIEWMWKLHSSRTAYCTPPKAALYILIVFSAVVHV